MFAKTSASNPISTHLTRLSKFTKGSTRLALERSPHVSYPHPEFNPEHIPVGYHITFRTGGTWLHGDARGSVDRNHRRYGTPMLPRSAARQAKSRELLKGTPVKLDAQRRIAIEKGIRDTCRVRAWKLWAFNIRSNHVHSVVTALCKPQKVLSALKANATREMREQLCWTEEHSPWAFRGSKKYLWTEKDLYEAIHYVLYEQGPPLKS
jgi:REP element-mobilizing transposase RayT